MAHKIVIDIVDPGDGKIKVTHIFWGETEAEAKTNYTHHLAACEYFQSAAEEGNVIEESFEIPLEEIPEAIDSDDEEEEEICEECGKPVDECIC